jgi:hypothetical protein
LPNCELCKKQNVCHICKERHQYRCVKCEKRICNKHTAIKSNAYFKDSWDKHSVIDYYCAECVHGSCGKIQYFGRGENYDLRYTKLIFKCDICSRECTEVMECKCWKKICILCQKKHKD